MKISDHDATIRNLEGGLPAEQTARIAADKALQAARCAGDQGKFREMHDVLSANPDSLGAEEYAKYAGDLGLDGEAFKGCIGSDKHLAEIRESGKGAKGVRIKGKPLADTVLEFRR
ncbi:MAG: hypothetical protein C4529_06900 [Deltaproteobacteria bacterium]|nr:MAG: hypothetical protein C4529_06900 [Deltaproteobacteria bacterium]